MKPHNSIDSTPDLTGNQAINDWMRGLSDQLRASNQRQLLVCEGAREWCLSMIPIMREIYTSVVLSNREDVSDALVFSKAETLLGQEVGCVIYDQFSGLNIDVLCMGSGLIMGGGLLVILRPPELTQTEDPYGQWQLQTNEQSHFRDYLNQQLLHSAAVVRLQQDVDPPSSQVIPFSNLEEFEDGITMDQSKVLHGMQHWMSAKNKPLFLLTADRGRGKSVTLGLFAKRCQAAGCVVISAAANAQVAILFKQLDAGDDRISFIAPDELIRRQSRIDLLIIDEAAMLPVGILQRCMELAHKTIMATTTGGYEGTGQGFVLKFLAQFESELYEHQCLFAPIRWGKNDLLEHFMNDALLLVTEACDAGSGHGDFKIQQFNKEQLATDIILLKAAYSLLVSAHYRTRPSDLRQLMDDENQVVIVASTAHSIVGVLLLNREGGLEPELCEHIFMGKRRPQGHLIAQMITAQAGVRNFAEFEGYRIQRIAVTDEYRKQGVARLMLEKAENMVAEQKLDYIGSSFALDASVALFWKKLGYRVVHIGTGRGKSSGRQTVVVIRSGTDSIQQVVGVLTEKLQHNLPVYLLTYCNAMLWQDVNVLLKMLEIRKPLSELDKDEILSVTQGFRGLELSIGALQRLLISTLWGQCGLSTDQRRLLIERLLLNKSWQQLKGANADSGRKQLTQTMRESLRICYECYQQDKNQEPRQ
jgi:tRNA(Met) cytidine acetyltransferase